ncbi:fasciclin domain-containing protein [Parasulfitobacter algicola]|uniref:Fasciclin domain-containing protein n=1 Tax=Parasulfitobacter algicola TaxID=2614809 RepID=A0ABX2IRV8_9RHOB|nr:fasciclin domain-containing protein [Sulfitobacter algicola]NSX53512.1 fasciclin domain-containing protein [Sulfitobacter algicola]
MKRRTTLKSLAAVGVLAMVAACASPKMEKSNDIVDVASANSDFSTLVAAVSAADLVDTLKSDGPFTVFAPTNAAFDALPAGTVENLLKPENKDQLTAILTYHVVPGVATSNDLVGKRTGVLTANGQSVRVDGRRGVRVNDANVVSADIMADNGVIHVIDKVLLPR